MQQMCQCIHLDQGHGVAFTGLGLVCPRVLLGSSVLTAQESSHTDIAGNNSTVFRKCLNVDQTDHLGVVVCVVAILVTALKPLNQKHEL